MATAVQTLGSKERRADTFSGTPRAHALDRWIFVLMAGWFIIITLTGFIPDSIDKVTAVSAGKASPFPLILHIHAVLMGSFLLLLLAQTWLVAAGRCEYHMQVGLIAFALVPALVIVGVILAPTIYRAVLSAYEAAPVGAREALRTVAARKENVLLMQARIGVLFPVFLSLGLAARRTNSGLHKRMMILGTAVALTPAFNRIVWLPLPVLKPLSLDTYVLAAVAPMFAWDVIRNRRVHEAYLIWIAISLPFALLVYGLWDTPWWHVTAHRIMS